MRFIYFITFLAFGQLLVIPAWCQQPFATPKETVTASAQVVRTTLQVGTAATSVLIFPTAICEGCIDRGHPDISTSPVAGVGNVLRVKAATEDMPESNLTVFTVDGRIYSFIVSYTAKPSELILDFTDLKGQGPAQFYTTRMNDAQIGTSCMIAAATKGFRRRPVVRSVGGMEMRLNNILLKDGVMFLKFQIHNGSAITYDIDFARLYIRDRTKKRRTSAMEKKVDPLYQLFSAGATIGPGSTGSLVIALPKFTIADSKFFCVEVFEHDGDRMLQLKLKGTHLLKARSF